MRAPLVSIITASYNSKSLLKKTAESIRDQTYKNIEWIIVDGQSNDGTFQEVIIGNDDIIHKYISEPDSGIYEAWNKGLNYANGKWIVFLGAGDIFKPHAIEYFIDEIKKIDANQIDLVSSKVELVDINGNVIRTLGGAFEWDQFRKKMTIAHVGAFHNKVMFQKYGRFDIAYKSSGDYDFLMRTNGNISTLFLDINLTIMLSGGVSSGYIGLYETFLIQKKYGINPILAIYLFSLALMKRFFRNLFGK